MSWETKGIDDARSGKEFKEPKKDALDHIGIGYSDKQVNQNKLDYKDGYKIGTSQRVADSNQRVAKSNSDYSSSNDGGSGK